MKKIATRSKPIKVKIDREEVVETAVPSGLEFIIKEAISTAMAPLRDKINKVASMSCQGSPLGKVTRVAVSLQIIPVLQMEFVDREGHKNAITLDQKLVQDGNQSGYAWEANLYTDVVRQVLTSIPELRAWQTTVIDFES